MQLKVALQMRSPLSAVASTVMPAAFCDIYGIYSMHVHVQ